MRAQEVVARWHPILSLLLQRSSARGVEMGVLLFADGTASHFTEGDASSLPERPRAVKEVAGFVHTHPMSLPRVHADYRKRGYTGPLPGPSILSWWDAPSADDLVNARRHALPWEGVLNTGTRTLTVFTAYRPSVHIAAIARLVRTSPTSQVVLEGLGHVASWRSTSGASTFSV